jgi:hypothetical protein
VISVFAMSTACRRGNLAPAQEQYLPLHFPNGVLGAADDVLHLACRFLCGPFGRGLGVAGHLADSLLDGALYLMSGAGDAIFVHRIFLGCFTANNLPSRKFVSGELHGVAGKLGFLGCERHTHLR